MRRVLAEAPTEHLAHNRESGVRVEGHTGLPQELVSTCSARLTGRIQSDAGLADPDQERSCTRRQRDSGMTDSRARLQHDAGKAADRDVRANPRDVHQDEGAIKNVQSPFL